MEFTRLFMYSLFGLALDGAGVGILDKTWWFFGIVAIAFVIEQLAYYEARYK